VEAIKIRKEQNNRFLNIKSSYYLQPSIRRARQTVACARYIIQIFNDDYNKHQPE
jgi:hypothetical protein